MDKVLKNKMEFIKREDEYVNIVFSTAKNNINYKKELKEGIKNIESLKDIFKLNDIYYVNQIHSSFVVNGNEKEPKGNIEGDAIVFHGKNIGIGVFTADCVPIILYDKKKNVIAAVHSGWKGTYNDIIKKTCDYIIEKYHCEDIRVVIGPHIGQCCYEVSKELSEKFSNKFSDQVIKNRYLSLEKCIMEQLKKITEEKKITSMKLCTLCSKEEFHSYRRDGERSGRLFSFVFIK